MLLIETAVSLIGKNFEGIEGYITESVRMVILNFDDKDASEFEDYYV